MTVVSAAILMCAAMYGVQKHKHQTRRKNDLWMQHGATENNVIDTLSEIIDFELGINIVDLGLIENINIRNNKEISIILRLTTSFCPYSGIIIALIKNKLKRVYGFEDVEVRISKTIWQPSMAAEKARSRLKTLIYGY